jgi:glycosyltransferase involved in cell wall biosynthesis
MRILHIIPQFPYFGGSTVVGGHASCLMTLAMEQHRGGCDVSILSYTEGQFGPRKIDDGPMTFSLFSRERTKTVRFGLRFCLAAARWLGARQKSFDVVHVHSGFADYFLVSALSRMLGLPTVHTLYCPLSKEGGRWRLPIVGSLIRKWANSLDWVGGMSRNVTTSLNDFGVDKAQWIGPALNIGRYAFDDVGVREVRKQLAIADSDLVVLFVGNAKPQKNAVSVVRAIHKLSGIFPQLKLVITTELRQSSSDEDIAALSREITSLGIESRVVQVGIVNNMPHLMMASDLFVAPFLDTLGPSDYFMAALEAMACGKPVVVSNVGGMPEVVDEKVGALVDPKDVDAMAFEVGKLLADKGARLRIGEAAKDRVLSMFEKEKIADAYRSVYRRVM